MPSKLFSRQENFFLQDESSYGVIPNAAGTATVAGANACRMIKMSIQRTTDAIFRKDKTGSRTSSPGIAGRKIGSFTSDMSLVTSGTPGTPPDSAPILKSLFGAAPSVKSGTVAVTGATNATPIVVTAVAHGMSNFDAGFLSGILGNTNANGGWIVNNVTTDTFELVGSSGNAAYVSGGSLNKAAIVYSPTDAELSFTAWSFRAPASGEQRAAFGIVAREATFNLGEDIATFQAAGAAKWVAGSNTFANATTTEKGGLTAFPTIPGSIVTNGAGIAGFKGRAVINNNNITRIRTGQIKFASGLELPRDLFGSDYVDSPEADERTANVNFNMYEEDTATQTAFEQAAIDKTSIDTIFQLGTLSGNIAIIVARGVQLASPQRDDGARAWVQSYGDSRAYGSGLTSLNEVRLWML